MIKNKMALLGAVTTLGMMGAVLASPAQAISLSAALGQPLTAGGLTLTIDSYSTFGANTSDTLWENYDVSFQQSGNNYIFDIGSNNLITDQNDGRYNVQYTVTGLPMTNFITSMGSFQTTGITSLNGNNVGVPSQSPLANLTSLSVTNSYTVSSLQGSSFSSGTNTITAVPWETDALSVIGVTTLFGFGVWTKRKRKVDLSK